MHPDEMAEFYRDVFEFTPKNVKKGADDPNHYLTDGHVTLVIMPWDITAYEGTGIITRAWTISASRSKAWRRCKEDVERIAAEQPAAGARRRMDAAPKGKKLGGAAFAGSCPLRPASDGAIVTER